MVIIKDLAQDCIVFELRFERYLRSYGYI
jgi:hypothetical protein